MVLTMEPPSKPRVITTAMRSTIFVGYSHADREWLQQVQTHLKPFLEGDRLELWDDTAIKPGQEWGAEILAALERARVAVLLVSPDFLASEFVMKVELPALLANMKRGLVIQWVMVRPASYEVTPLVNIQAALPPQRPLSTMPKPRQEQALVELARSVASAAGINAVANAFKIIDEFEPQVSAFMEGAPEPEGSKVHSAWTEQVNDVIHLVHHDQRSELITAADMDQLSPEDLIMVRAYERAMRELFERWAELKPKRVSQDDGIRRKAEIESDDVRKRLCKELAELLDFIESLGKSLYDHYHHVRFICRKKSS